MNWNSVSEAGRKKDGDGLGLTRKRGAFFLWAALIVAGILLFSGYTWAKRSVVVMADGKEYHFQTFSRTVGGALEAQKIVLLDKDAVEPPLDTSLTNGMVVTVERAVDVNITVDGRDLPARTRGRTVQDVLGEYGIEPGPGDEVEPARDTPVVPQMKIHVARMRTDTEVTEEAVEYETRKQYTTKLPQGATRVAREGKEGLERRTWQVTYRDGKEVSRQLTDRETILPPEDKLVMVGSGMEISRGGERIRYSSTVDMVASAYSHTGRNTSSGIYPHYGVVAVDPARIAMGTRLYVDGYGYATALDRGGDIKGNRIDLFFESESEAVSWGLRRVKVYLLD